MRLEVTYGGVVPSDEKSAPARENIRLVSIESSEHPDRGYAVPMLAFR